MPRFGRTDQRLRDDCVDLLGNSPITPVQLEDACCADFLNDVDSLDEAMGLPRLFAADWMRIAVVSRKADAGTTQSYVKR